MTKILTIILFLLNFSILKGQNFDSTVVSKLIIRSFMNDIQGSSILISNPLIVSTPSVINLKALSTLRDSIFSNDDLTFIETQMNQSKNLEWNESLIDSSLFISKSQLDQIFSDNKNDGSLGWASFHKLEKKRSFYNISIPYFTLDKQYCVVYISYNCGVLCGGGGLNIYKFKNAKWTLYKTLNRILI
jgi:hypothetical protein